MLNFFIISKIKFMTMKSWKTNIKAYLHFWTVPPIGRISTFIDQKRKTAKNQDYGTIVALLNKNPLIVLKISIKTLIFHCTMSNKNEKYPMGWRIGMFFPRLTMFRNNSIIFISNFCLSEIYSLIRRSVVEEERSLRIRM